MPTIQQLPQLSNVQPTDEVLVERSGTSYGTNVATLLASTQPALTLASGTLLGRVSVGSGGPEPVLPGQGITVQNGQLTIDQSFVATVNSPSFTGAPTAPTPAATDSSNTVATTAFVKAQIQSRGTVVLTGDVTGSGVGSIVSTLPAITAPGNFTKVTVNAKGQVVAGAQLTSQDVAPLLSPATRAAPGVVKIGNGLSIASDGTIDVNDGLKTVHDFGAVGDGQTDDTAAFAAYAVWLRQQLNSNGAQQAWVLGFGRRYIVSDSLDFTNFRYFTFEGHDSQIISNVKNLPAIDALGMENCLIRDLSLYAGAPSDPAFIGLQLGVYVDGIGHPQNTVENVTITGFFNRACVFNAGSETTSFVDLKLVNEYVGSTWCYGIIQDATAYWSIVSKYVSVTRTRNIGASFNENLFIKPVIETAGGGPAVWMSATHRHSYKAGYFSIGGGSVPIAVLNFLDNSGAAHTQSLLEWDVHAEVSPSATFLLTGYAAPVIDGLIFRDHLIQPRYLFSVDSSVTSVSIRNASIDASSWYSPAGATQRFFDTPARYSVQGRIYISSAAASVWQPPAAFVGAFQSDDISSFTFGNGNVIAQSFAKSQMIGPVVATGSLSAAGGAVLLGADATNPNIELGVQGTAANPYVDFNGAGVTPGYSARLTMDGRGQLTLVGPAATGAVFRAPSGTIQTGNIAATGTAMVAGSISAGSLSLTGTVAAAAVFAGPSGAAGSPVFRMLAASDVSGVESQANKGQPSGYAALDATGKVPMSALPAAVQGGLNYQGMWNASTNVPTLASGVGTKGFYFTVSSAGTTAIDGIAQWGIGDHIAFNGTAWEKLQGAASPVLSVAGRAGAVTLTTSDVSGLAAVASSGSYTDLANRPAVPAVATAGLVRSDGTTFTAASIGTGLSFSGGTLATTGLVTSASPVLTGNMRYLTGAGVAAAGTSQATATQLTCDFNEVTSAANGSNGVVLPDPGVGAEIVVRNAQGATALLIYPPSGQTIDLSTTNGAVSLGGNSTRTFRKMTATKWYSQ